MRILAKFVPLRWGGETGDERIVIEPGVELFDATDLINEIGPEGAGHLLDDCEESDQLWFDWLERLGREHTHVGPFRVEVQDAINAYFDHLLAQPQEDW